MYDIVIPTYKTKGVQMLDVLLGSISKFDNPSLSNILISDDGSDVETLLKLDVLKNKYDNIFNITIIYNPRFNSFSKTVNSGMRMSDPNNNILLLNNDMLAITSFEPFVEFMKERESNSQNNNQNNVGIIGAKLLYSDNTIQSVGQVRMRLIKIFRNIYEHRDQNHLPTNFPRKYISVIGACQYINRELINKIGYYDENYTFGYEDTDYCLNAQLNNYEVWYIPNVMMTHMTSSSITNKYNNSNRKLFWDKWNSSYESIRISQNISDDDIDIKVVEASGLTGLYFMFKKF
jgi:GT2 family glycosyltransferase